MTTKVLNIIEQMKTLTLVEASELIQLIEVNFGVDASAMQVKFDLQSQSPTNLQLFDVVLESVPKNRKVVIVKAVWTSTGLDFKAAKKAVNSTPIVLKKSVEATDALKLKQHLESYGALVSLQQD